MPAGRSQRARTLARGLLQTRSGCCLSELCERVESAVDNPQGRLEGLVDAIESEAAEVARMLEIDLRQLVS